MKVLVTGATGFTGSYVVRALIEKNVQVHCFVRQQSNLNGLPHEVAQLHYGDLNDQSSLASALDEVDVLVNIASLGFGHAPNVVTAALEAKIKRAIFISTTAIFTNLNAPSKATRLAAEATIMQSSLAYTILRPTMIYGSQYDRNMYRLIRYLKRWSVLPILGNGESLQQPVYVEDVAQAVTKALLSEQTINQAYNIPGAKALTYNQVIDTICKTLDKQVYKIHLPHIPLVRTLKLVERSGFYLPIKTEQILRLNENKTFDFANARQDFDYQPRTFRQGIALEIANSTGY